MDDNPLRKELESREEYYKSLINQMQKEIDKLQKLYNGKSFDRFSIKFKIHCWLQCSVAQ